VKNNSLDSNNLFKVETSILVTVTKQDFHPKGFRMSIKGQTMFILDNLYS